VASSTSAGGVPVKRLAAAQKDALSGGDGMYEFYPSEEGGEISPSLGGDTI